MWTTGQIAQLVGATCEGPVDVEISGVASLDHAGGSELSFCTGGRFVARLESTRAAAVLIHKGDVPDGVVVLRCAQPRMAFARAASAIVPLHWAEPGVHERAFVDPSAVVHQSAAIGPFAVIEAGATVGAGSWVMAHAYVGRDAQIGARCRLMPHAVVMDRTIVGDEVWLQPSAVVGSDGFGHVPSRDGPVRMPQLGIAVLEDGVEVGANACVDRAALDETRIGRGSRLDNLVQVAHGVRIGAHCLLAAFAGVAGSATLGDGVVMAGRTAVIDGIKVGDGAVFAGLASASRDVPAGRRLGGSPARRYSVWLREVASLRQLPNMMRRFARLERKIEEMDT